MEAVVSTWRREEPKRRKEKGPEKNPTHALIYRVWTEG